MLSGLKHPNIIRLLEAHFIGGVFYFVMEYAEGGPLVRHVYARCGSARQASRRGGGGARWWHACDPFTWVHMHSCHRARMLERTRTHTRSEGGLPEPEALRIFLQITSALEYCHKRWAAPHSACGPRQRASRVAAAEGVVAPQPFAQACLDPGLRRIRARTHCSLTGASCTVISSLRTS